MSTENSDLEIAERLTSRDWVPDPSAAPARRRWETAQRLRRVADILAPLGLAPVAGEVTLVAWSPSIFGLNWWTVAVAVIASLAWGGAATARAVAGWRYGGCDAPPPGLIPIKARGDERPGLEFVRHARLSALQARAAIDPIDSDARELLTPVLEVLDQSVWEMARAASESSRPEVIADLRIRAEEAAAVAQRAKELNRQLLEELPAYEAAAAEMLAVPATNLALENARQGIGAADAVFSTLSDGLEEARAAAGDSLSRPGPDTGLRGV